MRADDTIDAWSAAMRAGDFTTAWEVCDRILAARRGQACWHLPRHQQWIWDGSPVDGRDVLVRCYHGLGDTIQFARYLPRLAARARSLTVWAQPRVLPLLATMELFACGTAGSRATACPSCRLLPLHDGDPGIEFDVDMEIMELPHLFRTNADSIPAAVPYFQVNAIDRSPERRPAIGLVWQAGDWDVERSIPLRELQPLIDLPVRWYVLQGGAAVNEWSEEGATIAGNNTIMEAAAVLRALDLLITIDSMPAHLAGALGRRVWTLLPAHADWRWMSDRDDSPWYPTMRLFRQPVHGDWTSVAAAVTAELGALLKSIPTGL
jgi:hypothetical protein